MMATTSRLLTLLSLLQTTRDWPGSVLAERLGVSPRTVRRDVDRLRELGYNIAASMGPEGGYRLDAGNQLPPLLFDDDQVVALTVALRSVGAALEEPAVRALSTVRQVLPSRLRHRVDALEFTSISHPPGGTDPAPVSTDVLVALSAAVRSRVVLRFEYGSDAEARPPRTVEPHHLVTSLGRWYLVAWSRDRDAWRVFRADRITLRTPNGPLFEPRPIPGGDAAAFVSARFKGSDSANRWPCVGNVILHRSAREVLPFAGGGVVEDLGPHRCGLTDGSWSWIALAGSLNRYDTDVDVVGPAELRDAFALLAQRNSASAGVLR
ncbi:helix-turn-helix transcriptional regulator [Rhodococcus sp. IEGM 1330]|uniref:helix-turn-helix transcriptional regulator n=1 Tax=Rhodococcus sp. IEGM 1330 TaxID=3082225 RepID=UPI0029546334|nr:WYL domain-containing protein [Rhodococcus sp. IEGM 1330]MDV8022792.1 WYL domain-containing protein [Rhodococcus sp. IEGM 1330]